MPDIEKVINELQAWIDDPNAINAEIDGHFVADAFELLKEQQAEIDKLIKEASAYAELLIKYGII